MPNFQTLLERNRQFIAHYKDNPMITPDFSTFILTCVDARMDPARFFGLEMGEAFVFRSAGARVTSDMMLDLGILWTLAEQKMGKSLRDISLAIIHHTDCGFERLTNPEISTILNNRLGIEQAHLESLMNANHVQRIREDIDRLRKSSYIPNELIVSGYIYQVEDGAVAEVVPPAPLHPVN